MDNRYNRYEDAIYRKMLFLEWLLKKKNETIYSTELTQKIIEFGISGTLITALLRLEIIIPIKMRYSYELNKNYLTKDLKKIAIDLNDFVNQYTRHREREREKVKKNKAIKKIKPDKANKADKPVIVQPIIQQKSNINKAIIVLLAIISLILLIKL